MGRLSLRSFLLSVVAILNVALADEERSFRALCQRYPGGWIWNDEGQAVPDPLGWTMAHEPNAQSGAYQVLRNPFIREREDVGTFFPRRVQGSQIQTIYINEFTEPYHELFQDLQKTWEPRVFGYQFWPCDFYVDDGGAYCFLPQEYAHQARRALFYYPAASEERRLDVSSCIGINFYSAQKRYEGLWRVLGRLQQFLSPQGELSVLGDHGFWMNVSQDGGTGPSGQRMGIVSQGQFRRSFS